MKNLLPLVLMLFLAACGAPSMPAGVEDRSGLDLSTTRTTDQGAFQVRYTSELEPLAINELHSWILHVERPDGQPVTGATVTIDGGMPAHNHGLPTTPQVTEVGNGDYRVDGVKFQMPGEWTMTVDVDAGGVRDAVTFNLVLP
jgi:hypothetical protein